LGYPIQPAARISKPNFLLRFWEQVDHIRGAEPRRALAHAAKELKVRLHYSGSIPYIWMQGLPYNLPKLETEPRAWLGSGTPLQVQKLEHWVDAISTFGRRA
jgi:hypothetical protein